MSWRDRESFLGRTEGELRERFTRERERLTSMYAAGESGVLLNALPADALQIDAPELFSILRGRYGAAVDTAISPEWTDPDRPAAEAPDQIRSTVTAYGDTDWIRRTNMVGVNVRTVGGFIGVVQYALTLPTVHDSIHLLPIWEPGVVGSLYGMSSWKINGEFFSPALAELLPHLDSPARQLKATVNLLHLMGKSVGMDVIPHTDRYSEIVLSHPRYFEWLRREDLTIIDHRENLHEEVEERLIGFLARHGAAGGVVDGGRQSTHDLTADEHATIFTAEMDEATRDRILFGPADDPGLRGKRRQALARHLYLVGYEPVPATMAPPYRGLIVDPETVHRDADGHVWREYLIEHPESMSRVFGPLTRYKLYERHDDNRNWEIDFSRPRREVWRYVQERYGAIQRAFGFDFMRGDMSHVQMRSAGVPEEVDDTYDLLGSVGAAIRRDNRAPWFGYFAETFIAPPGVMAYGDEFDHLEASGADATLGDLQSRRVDSPEFIRQLRWYRDIADSRGVVPSVTVMTADKDDPRFDEFYLRGNEARYFSALFLTDMPSYTGLNFACRDAHHTPAPNEHYTKLYVFQERSGPKATDGPFQFGRNGYLFYRISRIRLFAEDVHPALNNGSVVWLLPPDATGGQFCVAWMIVPEVPEVAGDEGADDGRERTVDHGARRAPICIVNFGTTAVTGLHVPLGRYPGAPAPGAGAKLVFSTVEWREPGAYGRVDTLQRWLTIPVIAPGEGLFLLPDGESALVPGGS